MARGFFSSLLFIKLFQPKRNSSAKLSQKKKGHLIYTSHQGDQMIL
jgi:hypothetical protein